ncbi:MAG TPA: OsmC family protein [Burkholderiales bacterium]|nr:OsmC family protein [Burkholderiales bacterium]
MNDSSVREAIDRLSGVIAADPAKARTKNVPATARLTGGLKCQVSGPNNERAATDMPSPMGGAASAPNPSWLLRAGMASCSATVIAMRAAKLGIALTQLEVTVESDSDLRGILGLDDKVSAGLNPMRTKVRISGDAEPQALRALAEWADAHSPVGCTVRQSPACSLDIEVL